MVGPFNLDTLINFVDPASILIVLGGTLAVVVACYPKLAKSFPKHFKIMLRLDAFNPEQYVDKLTELAQIARKNGLLALEEKAKEQEDPFFQQAIMLIVDANDPDRVRSILENDIEQTSERHQEVIAMYERGSNAAPAFGMIGTLIGLINMLKNLSDSDMGTLGPSMSVALITTFYGSLLAHVLFNPIASNLTARDEEEILCRQIIVEGIMAIQSGENPKFLRERLMTFMNQNSGKAENPAAAPERKRAEAPQGEISRGLLQGGGTHDEKEKSGGGANWMDTYGDMVTLLLCFLSCSTPCLPWTRKSGLRSYSPLTPPRR